MFEHIYSRLHTLNPTPIFKFPSEKKGTWKGGYLYVSDHADSNDIGLKIHFFLNFLIKFPSEKKVTWTGGYLYVSDHADSNNIGLKIHFFFQIF